MSPTDLLLAAPFALLALAALPLPPLRRPLLYLLHRGGHLTLFAGVVACGVFAYRPDLAPDPLAFLPVVVQPSARFHSAASSPSRRSVRHLALPPALTNSSSGVSRGSKPLARS